MDQYVRAPLAYSPCQDGAPEPPAVTGSMQVQQQSEQQQSEQQQVQQQELVQPLREQQEHIEAVHMLHQAPRAADAGKQCLQ